MCMIIYCTHNFHSSTPSQYNITTAQSIVCESTPTQSQLLPTMKPDNMNTDNNVDNDQHRRKLPRYPSGHGDEIFQYATNGTAATAVMIANSMTKTETKAKGTRANFARSFSSSATETTMTNNDDSHRCEHKYDIEEGVIVASTTTTTTTAAAAAAAPLSSVDPGPQKPQDGDDHDGHHQVLFDDGCDSLEEEEEYFNLREDIYSLLILSPLLSPSFFFAIYVYLVKMTLFSILAAGIASGDSTALWTDNILTRVAQVRIERNGIFAVVA
jgi:hypothetical protein